ncbi:PAS domain-containing protein [Rhodanobacter sp. 7MK24]|uniref:chemotaxis protein CheB n=1 Tax=Rhodanobacter sp. 7MK24 TaxID=2775922 RepID=UPI00177CF876|nr:chemotaxis protein CheB [Rhodanobacter sp. 7MK24]MBD8882328.1 PAS domain-containing protein [Rhodanobacter sp. 7MK24]
MKKASSISRESMDKDKASLPRPAATPEQLSPLLVVGIGASAGGLEAYKAFFSNLHTDVGASKGGFAYVLVQHLSPEHVSLLAELVGRATTMPVTEATDGERVAPDHVYVIPPNATLTIADGVLKVSKPAPPRQDRWPINTFFASLAEDLGDCAVSIVLSGTGSDGALGLRAIKDRGGLTMAQSGFDHLAMSGMPASAASTGYVDDVLPVEAMPARLLTYRKQIVDTRKRHDDHGIRRDLGAHLRTLCRLLRTQVGHDFSHYKRSTLLRRIQRRMLVCQTETVPDYIAYLEQHSQEHQQLFRELLIGVTEFFRDAPAFAALRDEAIPRMLADKGAADTLRVWVPGCATGEEAYSIAILLREAIGAQSAPKVQIFATDLDDRAIDIARAGRYRMPLQGMTPERLERWFNKDGEDYCVAKSLREMCIFSPHSVIKDPPFSRLDLVSCRNLLIYMDSDLQERLFQTFHYALQPGGFLLLGPSESPGRSAQLFAEIDKKRRLYQRRESQRVTGIPAFQANERSPVGRIGARIAAPPSRSMEDSIDRNVRRVLEKYSPAYLVINRHHDILRFSGDTGRYLSPSTGTANLNVHTLLHKGLREPARALIREVFSGNQALVRDGLSVEIDGRRQLLRLIAEPLTDENDLCLLAFEERSLPLPPADTVDGTPSDALERIRALEHELDSARTQLHTAIELHESATEELKSANEEYQSVNEELQSANEELETSKEEMQSVNEELNVVNAEASSKNEILTRLNSDLVNLMDSTQIATLFLDRSMHIRNFTPAIKELFHLREGDRGRPITEISARINYPDLASDVARVTSELGVFERRLGEGSPGESVYLLRIRPYHTVEQVVDGVVLTFVDITQNHRSETARARLAAIVDNSQDAIIGYTVDDTITSWNAGAERILGYRAEQILGQPIATLLPPGAGSGAYDAFAREHDGEFEATWRTSDDHQIPVSVTNALMRDADDRIIGGALIARDITERRHAEEHGRRMIGELNHRVKNTLASVQGIVMQTLSRASSLEEFQTDFLARLQALSNTHNLLAQKSWEDVNLNALLLNELAPYQEGNGPDVAANARVQVQGTDVRLAPKSALALSMALHELTINAVKYGALSVPNGRIEVSWKVDSARRNPRLHLCWQEIDGPVVVEPTHRGFGARLIANGLPHELDGKVKLEFLREGVRCTIDVPLDAQKASP